MRRGTPGPRPWSFRNVPRHTTLPIAREIAETYVLESVKLPWYVDLLNINLDNHDLAEAKRRIALFRDTFRKDGTRITRNLDFERTAQATS